MGSVTTESKTAGAVAKEQPMVPAQPGSAEEPVLTAEAIAEALDPALVARLAAQAWSQGVQLLPPATPTRMTGPATHSRATAAARATTAPMVRVLMATPGRESSGRLAQAPWCRLLWTFGSPRVDTGWWRQRPRKSGGRGVAPPGSSGAGERRAAGLGQACGLSPRGTRMIEDQVDAFEFAKPAMAACRGEHAGWAAGARSIGLILEALVETLRGVR
jgi:hypothetical protein